MARKEQEIKTRPDLDDQQWLVWLAAQPENRAIAVAELYRKMLEWCCKKGVTPTRRRLLKWVDGEREAIPMTHAPAYFEPPPEPPVEQLPDCSTCSNERFVEAVIDPDAQYEWKRKGMVPCPKCNRPEREGNVR